MEHVLFLLVIISLTTLYDTYLHCIKFYKWCRDELKYMEGWAYVICKHCVILYKGLGHLRILVSERGPGWQYLLHRMQILQSWHSNLFIVWPYSSSSNFYLHSAPLLLHWQSVYLAHSLFPNNILRNFSKHKIRLWASVHHIIWTTLETEFF